MALLCPGKQRRQRRERRQKEGKTGKKGHPDGMSLKALVMKKLGRSMQGGKASQSHHWSLSELIDDWFRRPGIA